MSIDLTQLPIPNWDISCPHCKYPLRGLPAHRCPECGRDIDVAALVKTWTRVRDPRFTGEELPFPDFGLICRRCRTHLAGATHHACARCGAPFTPTDWHPSGTWFQVEAWMHAGVSMPLVELTLEQESIPFLAMDSRGFAEVYLGQRSLGARVIVASEFFFDMLHAVRSVGIELARAALAPQVDWPCPKCGEIVPSTFAVCWNCQTARP